MLKPLASILIITSALFLAACDKSAQDRHADAADHQQKAQQLDAAGKPQAANQQRGEAAEATHDAKVEEANKDTTNDIEEPR